MPTLHPIKALLSAWFLTGAEQTDPEYRRKMIMIHVVTMIAIAILILLGCLSLVQGNFTLGCLDLAMAGVLAILLVYLRLSRRYDCAARFGIFLMGSFFVLLFVTGGEDNTGRLWYYTFPLFASFLLGYRQGLWALR